MNKNTKQTRAILAKSKCDVEATRMRTMPNSSTLSVQKYTLHFGRQKQLSTRGKVGKCKRIRNEVKEIFADAVHNQ